MAKSNLFFLEIVSPQGIIFEGEVSSVTLPSYNGEITILPNHTPLFTKLSEGEAKLIKDGKEISMVTSGGFVEIKDNSVYILSDYAIRAESIELAKAEEKKREAEQKLKGKLDNEEFTIADKDLKMSILELKIAQKVRKRQRA